MNFLDSLKSYWASRATTEKLAKHNQPNRTNEGRIINSLNKDVTNTSSFLENNLTADQIKKDLAARTIQRLFKKINAAKSYKHMFDNGENFKQYKEILSKPKSLLGYLKSAQELSDKAINDKKNDLGKLSEQEQNFVQKVTGLSNPTLIHQTIYDLDYLNSVQEHILTIKSNLCLAESGVEAKGLTEKKDIEALSNNDFVFTSLNLEGGGLDIKPKDSNTGDSVYGSQAYLTHKKSETFGYLTLTDHYYNKIIDNDIRQYFCWHFPGLSKAIKKKIHGALGPKDVPIFTEKDMLLGLALYAIEIIRETGCDKLNKYIYADDISLDQLNEFLNVIFTPEFHIPRILSTTDFKLHKLREITDTELYRLVVFHKQVDMIRQHYLGECSTKDELINIQTYKNKIYLAGDKIKILIQEAIKDANAEVLSFCTYWYKEIKNNTEGYNAGLGREYNEHMICLSILQRNIEKIVDHSSKLDSVYMLLIKLQHILLKTEAFNKEICLCLNNIPRTFRKNEILVLLDLYAMMDEIEYLPDYAITYIDAYKATDFIFTKLATSEYKHFLGYAKLVAIAIMKNKYNLEFFSRRLNYCVSNYLPNSIFEILEDNILGVLYNPGITQEAKNILQQAFIDSGLLNPEKKINDSKDIILRDYAKEHYNIDL